jgi:hypothetical protein
MHSTKQIVSRKNIQHTFKNEKKNRADGGFTGLVMAKKRGRGWDRAKGRPSHM